MKEDNDEQNEFNDNKEQEQNIDKEEKVIDNPIINEEKKENDKDEENQN